MEEGKRGRGKASDGNKTPRRAWQSQSRKATVIGDPRRFPVRSDVIGSTLPWLGFPRGSYHVARPSGIGGHWSEIWKKPRSGVSRKPSA